MRGGFRGVNGMGRVVGEYHGSAKLTDAEAQTIRDEYATGMVSYRVLALRFDVSKATVRDIVVGRRRIDEATAFVAARPSRAGWRRRARVAGVPVRRDEG